MTQVKICGIKNLTIARVAIKAGANYLGFNFIPSSKRYINPEKAKQIIDGVGCDIYTAGVFQDAPPQEVVRIASFLRLDFVQLHGNETPSYCQKIATNVIKVFTLLEDFDVEETIIKMKEYSQYVNYFMVDKEKIIRSRMIDFQKCRKIANTFPLVLAGGLNAENVREVVIAVNPLVVDVASGIETNGKQDIQKIKEFIQNAKAVKGIFI